MGLPLSRQISHLNDANRKHRARIEELEAECASVRGEWRERGRRVGELEEEVARVRGVVPGKDGERIVPLTLKPCGDCRKPSIDACACDEHLRICEEQQRAERAEKEVESLLQQLALMPHGLDADGVYLHGAQCPDCTGAGV